MAKPLSEQLAELSVQAKKAEDDFAATKKQTHDKMVAQREQLLAAATQSVDIAASREDPNILRVDDAEIVGDGRRELVEPARHGFAQESQHSFGKVAEFGVAP